MSSQQPSSNNGDGGLSQIPDALLERMMDRKLRMLDLEYEECLKATRSNNIEDYDQGPTGDEWDKEIVTDPETAKAFGYAAFQGAASSSSDPITNPGAETLESDEWSAAWAEYKAECAEEEAEAKSRGITDDDVRNQTAPDVPAPAPKPLTQENISKIKGVMSGIKLKPPMWALGVPEEVWMAQILERAGYRKPGSAAAVIQNAIGNGSSSTSSSVASSSAAAADKQKLKKKAKKLEQKKKKKAALADSNSTSTSATTTGAAGSDDFEANFPAAQ